MQIFYIPSILYSIKFCNSQGFLWCPKFSCACNIKFVKNHPKQVHLNRPNVEPQHQNKILAFKHKCIAVLQNCKQLKGFAFSKFYFLDLPSKLNIIFTQISQIKILKGFFQKNLNSGKNLKNLIPTLIQFLLYSPQAVNVCN